MTISKLSIFKCHIIDNFINVVSRIYLQNLDIATKIVEHMQEIINMTDQLEKNKIILCFRNFQIVPLNFNMIYYLLKQ